MEKNITWRFINTDYHDAAHNMAVDEALLLSCRQGESPPVFRTYGWKPPGISFGYAQNPALEFNLEKCRAMGVDYVRRLTGGRAVYHHREVTYSVVATENDPLIGGSIHDTYWGISKGLGHGLSKLGIISDMEKSKMQPLREKIKSPCFSATSRYELTVNNKKLVGSAQRKMGGMILQHGSILLEGNQEEMVELTNLEPKRNKKLQNYLLQKTTSVSGILNRKISFSELVNALRIGFAEYFQLVFVSSELTNRENETVKRLILKKYGSDEWNFKPNKFISNTNFD